MKKLGEIARLDVGKRLRAKMGDTAYDVAGIIVRMIITLIIVTFALLMIKAYIAIF